MTVCTKSMSCFKISISSRCWVISQHGGSQKILWVHPLGAINKQNLMHVSSKSRKIFQAKWWNEPLHILSAYISYHDYFSLFIIDILFNIEHLVKMHSSKTDRRHFEELKQMHDLANKYEHVLTSSCYLHQPARPQLASNCTYIEHTFCVNAVVHWLTEGWTVHRS